VAADAHLVVLQSVDGAVLAELSVDDVVAAELLLLVAVGVDLIDEHGAVLTAVPPQVPLPVTLDIEPADHLRPSNRCLPDAGVHGTAAPRQVAWEADVYGPHARAGRARSWNARL